MQAEAVRPDELPPYEQLDAPGWGADLGTVAQGLFAADYQGLLRASDGSVVVYRNEDLHEIGSHSGVSHEIPTTKKYPMSTEGDTGYWLQRLQRNSPFNLRAPQHMPVRKLGTRRVTRKSMGRFSDIASAIGDDVVAETAQREVVDLLREFVNPILVRSGSRSWALDEPSPNA